MSLLPAQVVWLSMMLLAMPALAQPRAEKAPSAPRRIELPAAQGVAEVRVAPGLPTTLLFNARLDPSEVERAGRELGFARVSVAEDMVTVLPAAEVKTGTRLRLPVRFAEGPSGEGEAVVFVVDPLHAEVTVEVFRSARTVASLEEALAAERTRCTALEAELAAVHAKTGSLVALVAAGTLGRDGIRAVDLGVDGWKRPPELTVSKAQLYVATGRVALELELSLAAGAPPWAPQRATLKRLGGSVIIPARVTRWLGTEVLAAGDRARLVVEFELPTGDLTLEYTLEVMELGGQRPLLFQYLRLAAPAARKR